MKSLSKFSAAVLILILLMQIITLICTVTAPSAEEITSDIRYETMTKFGDIDENGTLFVDDAGNLFALDARFAEESGSEFVLKMDGRGTETPTDDVILDVLPRPAKF